MRDKIVISLAELAAWKADTYKEYASQTWRGKRLVFKANMNGVYLIQHGDDTLYYGHDINEAKRVWKEV